MGVFLKTIGKFTAKSVIVFLLSALTLVIVAVAVFIHGVSRAPVAASPNPFNQHKPITFYANDSVTVLAQLQPEDGVRKVVSSQDISTHMKNALVSAEDASFWDNHGVSFRGTFAAALRHLKGDPNAGGGSTITQQLVKNTVVGDEYSLERKWIEAISAVKTTAAMEKDEIITAYLNTIYFGRGALGVEQAAQTYFGVHASELSLSQSAFIAGVIQAPSRWDPLVNREGSEYRFNYVKSQMLKNGFITQQEFNSMSFPEVSNNPLATVSYGLEGTNGHVVSVALAELESKGISKEELHLIGASIVTTIDMRVNDVVVSQSQSAAALHNTRVSVAAVDPKSGAVRGMYGGDNGLGYNLADSPQMTGSTFKVFALAAALDNGVSPTTIVDSSPYTYNGVTVNNSGGGQCNNCNLIDATRQSLNTPFYRLQDMLPNKENTTQKMAQNMGVDEPLSESDGSVNKAIVLGTYGTSPLQLASGYATIANNGIHHERHVVSQVVTKNNQIHYSVDTNPQRVVSVGTTMVIRSILEPIAAQSNGNQLSGKAGYLKTGTVALGEHYNRDALAAGFTDNLAVSVWFGSQIDGEPVFNADGSNMWGAQAPSRLWRDILQEVG